MKNIFRIIAVVALMMLLSTESVWAGNDRRRGTSGAMELLINPWARSTGWGSANVSCVRGLDAFYSNIAGLSFINTIEVSYTNTLLAGGKSGLNSGASINSFGIAVRLFDQGVLGISLMAMGFGDIDVTTVESPEPINGTYSPTLMNLNFAYAHSFTQSIHGGVNVKIHSESTSNITASAFAVDAGIQNRAKVIPMGKRFGKTVGNRSDLQDLYRIVRLIVQLFVRTEDRDLPLRIFRRTVKKGRDREGVFHLQEKILLRQTQKAGKGIGKPFVRLSGQVLKT